MSAGFSFTPAAGGQTAWPELSDTIDSSQTIAIARMIERVCGTEAAVNYLADAVAVLSNRWRHGEPMSSARRCDMIRAGARSGVTRIMPTHR